MHNLWTRSVEGVLGYMSLTLMSYCKSRAYVDVIWHHCMVSVIYVSGMDDSIYR